MVQPRTRAPLTHDQRTFVRVAARQYEIGLTLVALEHAAEKAARKAKEVRTAAPPPTPQASTPPAKATRRQPPTCPSRSRYRRHRAAGETCQECSAFMRQEWHAAQLAHPEWRQRALDKRSEQLRTAAAAKTADTAARKAAVMAKFVKDAA